ncbi:hypothetical protein B0H16DRAFT_1725685 [Mycena metata]|uniref:AMP-dependent synthetase/ligase domain-containing protein n=1 Tax=Mycena metata TaxID=1033252 RepID=A0AAD7IT13_9AGAR|nr:hypothetical protein B0H16DRAFT_1725685 [Mycena metata]
MGVRRRDDVDADHGITLSFSIHDDLCRRSVQNEQTRLLRQRLRRGQQAHKRHRRPHPPRRRRRRRLAISADKLVTQPFAGIDTVYDVLQYVAKTHGTRGALGWRDIVDVHEEAKEVVKTVNGREVKEIKKWKLSGYTYVQLKEQVDEIARGLVDLGLTTDDVFNIYAATRWVLLFGFRLPRVRVPVGGGGVVPSSRARRTALAPCRAVSAAASPRHLLRSQPLCFCVLSLRGARYAFARPE